MDYDEENWIEELKLELQKITDQINKLKSENKTPLRLYLGSKQIASLRKLSNQYVENTFMNIPIIEVIKTSEIYIPYKD